MDIKSVGEVFQVRTVTGSNHSNNIQLVWGGSRGIQNPCDLNSKSVIRTSIQIYHDKGQYLTLLEWPMSVVVRAQKNLNKKKSLSTLES